MKKLALLTALLVLLSAPVAAQNQVKVEAHEVRLATLRLPPSEIGTVAFKTCNTCDFMTRRVTANTRWQVNNRPVRFSEFQRTLATLPNRTEQYVTVHHDLRSDLITEIAITVY